MFTILFTICMMVYRKVFYIWTESFLGDFETTLYRGIFPGDIDRNGSWRLTLHCISAADYRWDPCTCSIQIVEGVRKVILEIYGLINSSV